jgi:hypothetical protein
MQTCSPVRMRRVTPSRAGRSVDAPRTTVTLWSARSGGGVVSDSGKVRIILPETRADGSRRRREAHSTGTARPTIRAETIRFEVPSKIKKEVKTVGFSPPGVGWGVTEKLFRRPRSPALPGRSGASLVDSDAIRGSPPKGFSLGLCSIAPGTCQPQMLGIPQEFAVIRLHPAGSTFFTSSSISRTIRLRADGLYGF